MGSILSLTEDTPGATPTIAISEPSPDVGLLKIDLGPGHIFAETSTIGVLGLTYEDPDSPTTSQFATIDISLTNSVTSLQATLPGDTVTLGLWQNLSSGVGNIVVSAGTIEVAGVSTLDTNGSVDLKATSGLTIGSGATVKTGLGTISLAADVNADGTGDDGVGTLTIGAGATVTSSNPTASAITLRGADVEIDTSIDPALVGCLRVLTATPIASFTGLSHPQAPVFDGRGNLYVANDGGTTVSVFAPGSTTPSATLIGLCNPNGLAFDSSGNLYVTNHDNSTVSVFEPGSTTPNDTLTLTGLNAPYALAFDDSGKLYVTNRGNGTVSVFEPGSTTPDATLTGLSDPLALAFDSGGKLYVANWVSYGTVSVFEPGRTTPSATLTGLRYPQDLAFDSSGNLYVANAHDWTVSKFAPGSLRPSATLTGLNDPTSLAFDSNGNLYVANYGYGQGTTVRVFTPGSTTPSATLAGVAPYKLTFDRSGNLYVTNYNGATVSVFAPGGAPLSTTPSTTLTGLSNPNGLAFDSSGNLYVTNYDNSTVSVFEPGRTTPNDTLTLTGLNAPYALAFDDSANLYVTNRGNGTVSVFEPGSTTPSDTLTGLSDPLALAFDSSGRLYVANWISGGTVSVFEPGRTTPSTTLTGLRYPQDLAFDSSGNLYVANAHGTTVSKFAPGSLTPSATLTGLNDPTSLAFDSNGNLYVANYGYGQGTTVSVFTPGSTTPSATLTGVAPYALAFDSSGNLHVTNYNGATVSAFAPGSTNIVVAGGVAVHSSLATQPMSLGGTNDAVTGINLTDAELAQIQTTHTGTVTIGDQTQTGNITFTTATVATTTGASTLVMQATLGAGQIVLDDAGNGTGLNANGAMVNLMSGSGGIQAIKSAAGLPLATRGFDATGLTLTPTLSFTTTPGMQLIFVKNTATPATSNPVTGTFAGLQEGAIFTIGSRLFAISYAGGDGNDVVLTDVNAPAVEAGADCVIAEGSSLHGYGWFTDPAADGWSATVDYGDGSGTQALAFNADKTFALNHVYDDDSIYTVTVNVTNDHGRENSDTLAVSVVDIGGVDWVRQFGGFSSMGGCASAVDANGDVYIAGGAWGYLLGDNDDAIDANFREWSGYGFLRKYDASGNEIWTRRFGDGEHWSGEDSRISTYDSDIYVAGTFSGGHSFVCKFDASGNEQWLHQLVGPSYYEHPRVKGISAYGSGVYVAGWTGSALPGQSLAGLRDAFVRKYDTTGTEIWTRQFGSASYDEACDIFVDFTGVYVAGSTDRTLPGQSSAGSADAFVRKYDTTGTEIWTRQFGTSLGEAALDISVDYTGVYVAGYTFGTLSGPSNAGRTDLFVRKYNVNGTEQWSRQFGSPELDTLLDISTDGTGVYVAGSTAGVLAGTLNIGGGNVFVRKYDASGNESWTCQAANSGGVYSVFVDMSGIFTAGTTVPWGGEAFLRAYDINGAEQWTRQFGSVRPTGQEAGKGVATDPEGNIYIAGTSPGWLASPSEDPAAYAFVRKYDANWNELWTRRFPYDEYREIIYREIGGICADDSGVYITGYFCGPPPPNAIVCQYENYDVYVLKYDSNGNLLWNMETSEDVIWDNDYATGICVSPLGVCVAGYAASYDNSNENYGFVSISGNELQIHASNQNGSCDTAVTCISADASGIYVAGHTAGALLTETPQHGYDAFLRKYDASGNELWTRQFAVDEACTNLKGIFVDETGIYVTGDTDNWWSEEQEYWFHTYVRKYDTNGAEQWTRRYGSNDHLITYRITGDSSGIYVTGDLRRSLNDEPHADYGGDYDVFVYKLDASGSELWTRQFGTAGDDCARGICAAGSGVYVTGGTGGLFPEGTSTGSIYVARLDTGPTDIGLSNATVLENQPVGTPVGTLSTTHARNDNPYAYTLVAGDGDTDNILFSIVGDVLQTSAVFDFESQSSFSIRVRSTSDSGLAVEKVLSVGVTDVTGIAGIAGSADGVPGQTRAFTLSANGFLPADPDASYTYYIDWNGDNIPDETISGLSSTDVSHIFTDIGTYNIAVTATDEDGEQSLAGSHTIQIANVVLQGDNLAVGGSVGNDTIFIGKTDSPSIIEVNGISQSISAVPGQIFAYGLSGDDTVEVYTSGSAGLRIYGQEGSDTYTVNFGNLKGPVTVEDNAASEPNILQVNGTDEGDAIIKIPGLVAWGRIVDPDHKETTPVTHTVIYSGVERPTLDSGDSDDYIRDYGASVILGGAGNDTIIITATLPGAVVVDGQEGSDAVFVVCGALIGAVEVTDSGGDPAESNSLTIQGTAEGNTFAVTDSAVTRTAEAVESITYSGSITNLVLETGQGTNSVRIESTATELTINAQGGMDSCEVQLGSLAAPVAIANPTGTGSVSVSIVGTDAADALTLSGTGIQSATETITLLAPVASLTVDGGDGDDQITISALDAPVGELTLDGGDGSDTFTIVDLGSSAIESLTVEGGIGTGNDQVVVEGELPLDVEVDLQHVAPIVSVLEGPSSGVPGQTLAFTGRFTDSDENTWSATVDYGDGTGPQSLSLNADRSFQVSHVYSHSGDYTITVTVDDHDGGVSSSSIPVAVRAVDVQRDPNDSTKAILAIGGTTGSDIILVTPGLRPGHYLVWINCWLPGSFTAPAGTSLDQIVAFGQAGDDDIMIAGCVEITAWLYGGAGHDRLKGGGGHNVLLGGEGDDLLTGGKGRDLMIGGLGADRLVGNADDDILISGATAYDANDVALRAILNEWTSTRTYAQRTANLLGTGTGDRLNGACFLQPDVTVYDDNAKDTLTGCAGRDWFFANVVLDGNDDATRKDKITDLSASEFALDLDFINSEL